MRAAPAPAHGRKDAGQDEFDRIRPRKPPKLACGEGAFEGRTRRGSGFGAQALRPSSMAILSTSMSPRLRRTSFRYSQRSSRSG